MFTGDYSKQAVVPNKSIKTWGILKVEKSWGSSLIAVPILVFEMLAPGNQPSVANGRSEYSKTQVIGRIGNLYRAGWEDWIYGANCFDHTVAGPSRDRQDQVWK